MTTATTEDSLTPANPFGGYDATSDYGPLVFLCQKEDVIKLGEVLMPFFFYLVSALSLIGNGMVLCVLLRHGDQKNVATIFVCNLATSDLVFATSLPFWAVYHSYTWIFGDFLCRLVSGTFYIGFYSSIMFLTSMAVDRFFAVVHATTATRNTRYAATISGIIWGVSVLLTIPEFMFYGTTQGNEDGIACEHTGYPKEHEHVWKLLQYFQQAVLFFLVPFGIILFCYSRIVKRLFRCRTQRKHRALKMIFSIIIAFFLCWTPLNISMFFKLLQEYDMPALKVCKTQKILDISMYVSRNLAYFHCCLNPVLYAFLGTNVRKHLKYPCFIRAVWPSTTFRPRIFSNSSAHSSRDSSAGNSRVRVSTVL